jgi:hypothetical protein
VTDVISLLGLRLPGDLRSDRAKELKVTTLATLHDELRIHRASVDDMLGGCELMGR